MKNVLHFELKDKSTMIPLIAAIVLLSIVFVIAFLAFDQSRVAEPENNFPSVIDVVPETITVDRVVPSSPYPLTPGLPYSYNIYFKESVSLKTVSLLLTASSIYGDDPAKPVNTSIKQLSYKSFLIKTDEPIQPYSEYILTVINKKTKEPIFTKGYMTRDFVPTPVPSNNPRLVPFLPQVTDAYVLEFIPEKNVYIFHFKYNPDLPASAEAQYNNAQKEATQFIQSKGINIDSIVIEWRYN